MAEFVPTMPSEDEDFDAVLAPVRQRKPRTSKNKVVDTSETVAEVPLNPAAISVPVATDEPVEEATYEMPAETAQEAAYANVAPEPEARPVPEQIEAPTAPEYVEPFNQPEAEPAAVKAPRQPRTSGNSLRRVNPRLIIEALLVLALIGLGLWSWQLYSDRQSLKAQLSSVKADPQLAIKQQSDDLIRRVGELMTLPSGETPTIANVSDAAQARKQSAFFNNAQNGDRVLMYVKAGEAILYRPSTNKIILVAPLTFNDSATTSTQKP